MGYIANRSECVVFVERNTLTFRIKRKHTYKGFARGKQFLTGLLADFPGPGRGREKEGARKVLRFRYCTFMPKKGSIIAGLPELSTKSASRRTSFRKMVKR